MSGGGAAIGWARHRPGAALLVAVSIAAGGCSITEVRPDVIALRSDAPPPSTTIVDDPFVEVEPDPDPPSEPTDAPDDLATEPVDPVDDASRTPAPIPDPVPPIDDPIDADLPDTSADGVLSDEDVAEIVAELESDGFCDPFDFEDEGAVTAIHFVVAGRLQPPCHVAQPDDGVADVVIDDDPRLIAAWEELLRVTPTSLVDDISLIAGYEACSTCDTLAYVTTLDVAAEFFIIAVDVVAGAADPDELRLTMLHELAHVFTQRPGEQLVVQGQGAPCDTFFNGNGCFTAESYMWAWIQEFWPPVIRDTLPTDGSVGTDDEAFARCDVDARYTGSYAAVHPEEDFAETFSAYVFDVEVDAALSDKFAFFDRYPELAQVRDNARAAGLAGTEGNFEGCGS